MGHETAEGAVEVVHRLANWVYGVEPVIETRTDAAVLARRTALHDHVARLNSKVQRWGTVTLPEPIQDEIKVLYLDFIAIKNRSQSEFAVGVTSWSWMTIQHLMEKIT
jgi:hypothetical protein